jgi:fibro-slime domain-containing protein/uncharacterized repeat protein (TIGR02543 family)
MLNQFTMTGWRFAGWSTDPSGKVEFYDAAKITLQAADITLYAIWSQNIYSVTFNINDNLASGTMSIQTISSGFTAKLIMNTFSKPGWQFAGWAETPVGNVVYHDGENFTIGSSDVILYAKWTPNNYAIIFDKNDPAAEGSMAVQTIACGTQQNLNINTFSKVAFRFAGWAITAGGDIVYNDRSTYIMGPSDDTLYAKWVNTYTIVYNGNNYTSGSIPIDAKTYLSGDTALVKDGTGLKKTGYTFSGWNTMSTGIGTSYSGDGSGKIIFNTQNITLFAQWRINTYKVKFETDGGTHVDSQIVNFNAKVTEPPLVSKDTTVGSFIFEGWFQDKTLTTLYDFNTPVTDSLVLYAKWEYLPTTILMPVTCYDFHSNRSNPEFEPRYAGLPVRTKMVANTLGPDSTFINKYIKCWFRPWVRGDSTVPVYLDNGNFSVYQKISTDSSFYNLTIPVLIRFLRQMDGTYEFSSLDFFPIDGRGFGSEGLGQHNYSFTMVMRATFTKRPGLVFEISGDDDIWVFMNGKLILDLGGIHTRASASCNLDNLPDNIGLQNNQTYNFDLFFCERRTSGSSLTIRTNMNLKPR